jgi:chromosomal replication initiation ATPase DnaA
VTTNPWNAVLAHLRGRIGEEDFRRWFGPTAYASDAGDQITVWVPTAAIQRHLAGHFEERINEALAAIDRPHTHVRFIVTGYDEDEDEDQNP